MIAEVAFVGSVGGRVDVDGVIGAGVHAALAADAVPVVEVDHSVGGSEQRSGGADRDAGGVVAMVAAHHREMPVDMGERAGLDVLDPGAVHSEGNLVFALASNRAGMTADAAAAVEQEPEPGHAPDPITVSPCLSRRCSDQIGTRGATLEAKPTSQRIRAVNRRSRGSWCRRRRRSCPAQPPTRRRQPANPSAPSWPAAPRRPTTPPTAAPPWWGR